MKIRLSFLSILFLCIIVLYRTISLNSDISYIPTSQMNDQLLINEVVSKNVSIIPDDDWDYSDYIELYNNSDSPLDLTGMGLSDDPTLPLKWTFPQVSIAAHQYLIVFASGKDRFNLQSTTNGQPVLHTNFKLSEDGDKIALSDPQGNILSTLILPNVIDNMSFGLDEKSEYVFYTTGSPNEINTGTKITDVATYMNRLQITASIPSGYYTSSQTVTLTCGDPTLTLRYTLDGTIPTYSSPIYDRPIYIASRAGEPNVYANIQTTFYQYPNPSDSAVFKGTVLNVRAFDEDLPLGTHLSNIYLIDEAGSDRYSLPVLAINIDPEDFFSETDGINVVGSKFKAIAPKEVDGYTPANYNQTGIEWERPVHLTYIDTDGRVLLEQDAGIRVFGGYTRFNPKKSYKIFARSRYDTAFDSFNNVFFDNLKNDQDDTISDFKTLVLRSGGNDWNSALIRDPLLQSLAPDSIATQTSEPCILMLNGEYWGIYYITEPADESYVSNHYDLKSKEITTLKFNGEGVTLEHGEEQALTDFNQILDFAETQDLSIDSNLAVLEDQIDLDNLIDYYVSQIYFVNTDWPSNNTRLWRSEKEVAEGVYDGRFRYILYDTDFGFGLYDVHSTVDKPMLTYLTDLSKDSWPNPAWSNQLFTHLLKNRKFKEKFIIYSMDLLNTSFTSKRVNAAIDAKRSEVATEMTEYIQRWSLWQIPNYEAWNNGQINKLRNFANMRPSILQTEYRNFFDLEPLWKLTLNELNSKKGVIVLNDHTSIDPTITTFEGKYFSDYPITLTAVPKSGYRFVGWTGDITSEEATITIKNQTDITLSPIFDYINNP